MGIFKEIKKLFFASSSVAKSATNKAAESITEVGTDIGNKTKQILSDTSEDITTKTAGLRDSVLEKADDLWEKSKNLSVDVVESVKDNELANRVSNQLNDFKEDLSNNELVKKAAEFTENVGGEVLEKGEQLLDKASAVSEDFGKKANELKDIVVEKAINIKEDLSEKIEDIVEKEKVAEAIDESKIESGFSKETLDTGESLLKGTDDFFSRASKYADGEYDSFDQGKMDITQGEQKPQKPAIAAGFVDNDGDGNEIIDDAQIVDEEE